MRREPLRPNPPAFAVAILAALAALAGCSWQLNTDNVKIRSSDAGQPRPESSQAEESWRRSVLATCFWVGEPGNEASAWDPRWLDHFGGVDSPEQRDGWLPGGFTPSESTFYCALPYNDVAGKPGSPSRLHGRWVEVRSGERSCFCRWQDVGPWFVDDRAYVLDGERPRAESQGKAGIDLSPACCDYLGLRGRGTVDWRFVEAGKVPAGPWFQLITGSSSDTSVSGGT